MWKLLAGAIGLWCVALSAENLSKQRPWLAHGSTVVLVSGLPGDAETENAYAEQLANWLELLAHHTEASNCVVLCDQPGGISLAQGRGPPGDRVGETAGDGPSPPLSALRVLKADRENFLQLPSMIPRGTNPLTVIVWGHGGKQGSTPVLHVRGPRLTPSDFEQLSKKLPGVSIRWILLFRGSGSFARTISGPLQEVLSSDLDTMFSGDPAGMPLLLKLARNNPNLTLRDLAGRFGQAVGEWYEQRSLARIEEPTLWLQGQEPQSLIDSASHADNYVTVQAEQSSTLPEPRTSAAQDQVAEARTNLFGQAGDWQRIQRVRAQDYPGADAVVLRSRQTCSLGSSPAIVTEKEEFVQILSAEGKRFGDFDLPFAPPHEELELLECEVQGPDGKVVRLEPDAIGNAGEDSVGGYQGPRRKFFSLPGAVPGSVLHIHYRSQWKEFPLPHVSLSLPIGGELPVVESSVQIKLPRQCAFHFAFEGISAPEPQVSQTGYSTVYCWHLANIAAEPGEPLQAPHRRPGLLLSTFPDWRAFAEWYARISRMADEQTPEIAQQARKLTEKAGTSREKLEALYNYVTSLRYVAVPLGVNSLRPHAAANVLENQFGDCKDKANLLNALLHALNIQADLVLVPRFSQASDQLPGLAFNHAISRVKLGEEIFWADTTDEICHFGLLPPGDPGRKVLVADGNTTALTQLELPHSQQHRLMIHGKLTCVQPETPWPLELTATGSGYADYQLRRTAQEGRERRGGVPLLAAKFRMTSGSFALEEQTATPVGALDQDFRWQGRGTWIGAGAPIGGKCALHSPFWLPKEWDLALQHRRTPLFLNEGYPITLEEKFEMALPPGAQTEALPSNGENTEGPLRWRIAWTRPEPGKLVAQLHAELVQGELSLAETAAFQKQLGALMTRLGSDVLLSWPAPPG